MNRLRRFLLLVLAIVALICIAYGVWCAFAWALSWIMAQKSQIAAAIIAFTGTVIAGIGAVIISQQRSKAREIAESHRTKKIELYSTFITKMIEILRKHRGADSAMLEDSKEIEEFFYNFTAEVVLWGSPGVLRHYATFRHLGQNRNPNVIIIMDDIMQAMRKDLGLSNRGLSRGDLMKMFLTDPDSLNKLLTNHS